MNEHRMPCNKCTICRNSLGKKITVNRPNAETEEWPFLIQIKRYWTNYTLKTKHIHTEIQNPNSQY